MNNKQNEIQYMNSHEMTLVILLIVSPIKSDIFFIFNE